MITTGTPLEAIILDTETTHNKPDDPMRELEVVELGWRGVAPDSPSFARLYLPKRAPTFGATSAHHILMSDLVSCAPSSQAPHDLPAAEYWIGHNIDFDWKALKCPPVKRICTLALSRSLWPELDSHTLSSVMYYTQGCTPETRKLLRGAHSAVADCEFVAMILQPITAALGIAPDDFARLYDLSEEARIPKTWTFGKFKDQPIEAADRGYAAWCNRQPDFDPYVIIALKRAGLLR